MFRIAGWLLLFILLFRGFCHIVEYVVNIFAENKFKGKTKEEIQKEVDQEIDAIKKRNLK